MIDTKTLLTTQGGKSLHEQVRAWAALREKQHHLEESHATEEQEAGSVALNDAAGELLADLVAAGILGDDEPGEHDCEACRDGCREHGKLIQKFNGGSPVLLCEVCRVIVSYADGRPYL